MKDKQLQIVAWIMSLIAVVLAVVGWGQGYDWQFSGGSYVLFPLFGLLAFSLMWSHYMAAAIRLYLNIDRAVLKNYFEVTSLAVLAAILLHPGLLWWQLWRDGLGLPPGSYLSYVAPGMGWIATLGTISLLLFLAFELRRKFGERSWWKYVAYGSDAAMLFILYHSLRLGSQLQAGWLRTLWYFYGITLAAALVYIYYKKFTTPKPQTIVKS